MVFVTQLVDPDDPVLGFVVGWVRALAARCDRLWVIANEVRSVPADLGAEVISLGKEAGKKKLGRGLVYESALLRVVRKESVDTLIAHMCPVYLNLAAPITKAAGVRTLLWFAHPADSRSLRIAGRLADVVVSSLEGAYPSSNGRVRYIGQGIDTQRFSLMPVDDAAGPLRCLMLNRLSPVKGVPVVLRAMALLAEKGIDSRLQVVGPATTPAERGHRDELLELIDSLELGDRVTLDEGVSPAAVPALLAASHVVINATARGSGDKTILEAMAVGRPVILSNHVFAPLVEDLPLPLLFRDGDAAELADRVAACAAAARSTLGEVGRELSRRVAARHSLDQWADRVVAIGGGA
jgi:glycosyltransferase involved in cell wall biosynthesis